MVIVQGTFTVDPASRDEYLEASKEQMRISRAEQGCLEYVLAADPLELNRVVLSERWATQADLDAHIAALTARREAAEAAGDTPAVTPLTREVEFFQVTATNS
jgi:quinol monooxygenase YgiN